MFIDLFVARGYVEKENYKGGVPYDADDSIHNWDNQSVAST